MTWVKFTQVTVLVLNTAPTNVYLLTCHVNKIKIFWMKITVKSLFPFYIYYKKNTIYQIKILPSTKYYNNS